MRAADFNQELRRKNYISTILKFRLITLEPQLSTPPRRNSLYNTKQYRRRRNYLLIVRTFVSKRRSVKANTFRHIRLEQRIRRQIVATKHRKFLRDRNHRPRQKLHRWHIHRGSVTQTRFMYRSALNKVRESLHKSKSNWLEAKTNTSAISLEAVQLASRL